MSYLVGNGQKLYRRSGSLVRSPIFKTLTLYPNAQLCHDIGDTYKQVLPTRDFLSQNTGYYAIDAGHKMRKAYLYRQDPSHDSSGWLQIWRNNNIFGNNDTGYVFYNGNYSPAWGYMSGAAFIRLAAYRFTVPADYIGFGWTIAGMTVTTINHGIVLTSGRAGEKKTQTNRRPVFTMDASSDILPSDSDWRDSTRTGIKMGVFSTAFLEANGTASRPMNLYSQCQHPLTLTNPRTDACDNLGSSCAYPLWITWPDNSVQYADGNIIHARNPYYEVHPVSPEFLSAANGLLSGGSFYVTMIPAVGDSGINERTVTANDYPYYYMTGTNLGPSFPKDWWLCERVQIANVVIDLALG